MCLAVPGKILSLHDGVQGTVDMLGAQRDVSLRLTPDAAVGDYVLVHAGFSIQVIDEKEAAETLALVEDLADLVDEELPPSDPPAHASHPSPASASPAGAYA